MFVARAFALAAVVFVVFLFLLQQLIYDFLLLCTSDGKITIQEMINAVRRLNNAPSEDKCRKIAEMLDQDKDGTLQLDEIGMVSFIFVALKRIAIQLKEISCYPTITTLTPGSTKLMWLW